MPIGDIRFITFHMFDDFLEFGPFDNNFSDEVNAYITVHDNLFFMAGLFLRIYQFIVLTKLPEVISAIFGLALNENAYQGFSYFFVEYLDCLLVTCSLVFAALIVKKLYGN